MRFYQGRTDKSFLTDEQIDSLAEQITPLYTMFEGIIKGMGGIVAHEWDNDDMIKYLLSHLEKDGDRTGTGRIYVALSVFDDDPGFSVDFEFAMGAAYSDKKGNVRLSI